MAIYIKRPGLAFWQAALVIFGTSWLFAPSLNDMLSSRVSLISQYELPGQPYSWLFRACDIIAAGLILGLASYYRRLKLDRVFVGLLMVVGFGMFLDPIFSTTCKFQGGVCMEQYSFSFMVHAAETVLTAFGAFALAIHDIIRRKRLVSIAAAALQVGYGALFLSQYVSQQHFNTLSQMAYQSGLIVWLAWLGRDFLASPTAGTHTSLSVTSLRKMLAGWVFFNGFLAISASLIHLSLYGRISGLYFAGHTAWLAQHGVIAGVVMLYLARHILRGELRARQIMMALVATEVMKYAVLTPHPVLLSVYALTFVALFVSANDFQRGSIPMTWEIRLKDLKYMIAALAVASLSALLILDRDDKVSRIAHHAFSHLLYYDLHTQNLHRTHLQSALLAHTATAFILAGTMTVLWILFRPYKLSEGSKGDPEKVKDALDRYAQSSEDFFKLWPDDKKYFWNAAGTAFVAYKIVGPVAFCLADPIASANQRSALVSEFTSWARKRRLKTCFLMVFKDHLPIYRGLNILRMGASAHIDTAKFESETLKGKWWRWKTNRAAKAGYVYSASQPPHSAEFMEQLRGVSDAWLADGTRQERGFALGYYDDAYMQSCTIHYLNDASGKMVAFANQLPAYPKVKVRTIDLLRHLPEANDTMPYLMSQIIISLRQSGFTTFDLGFAPFATVQGPLQTIARLLSAGRFSVKGLEQFKNKFEPDWVSNYLAYDGDLADLAVVALNLELALKI